MDRTGINVLPTAAAGAGLPAAGRVARPGLGLLRVDGPAVARLVHDQLAVAPVRQAPLRDQRRLAQQLDARHPHHRRGLAQQPPPLHELGAPGLPLVGDRRDVLRDQGAVATSAWCGTSASRRATWSRMWLRRRRCRSAKPPPSRSSAPRRPLPPRPRRAGVNEAAAAGAPPGSCRRRIVGEASTLNVVPSRSGDRTMIDASVRAHDLAGDEQAQPDARAGESPSVVSRRNASKMPDCAACGIGGPTLCTSMATASGVASRTVTLIGPPVPCWIALLIRFDSTCAIRSGSNTRVGRALDAQRDLLLGSAEAELVDHSRQTWRRSADSGRSSKLCPVRIRAKSRT